jgi:hypothetical protein
MSTNVDFVQLTRVGQQRIDRQYRVELVTRFVVLRNFDYQRGMDVHHYLDEGMINVCSDPEFDWTAEIAAFRNTMSRLLAAVGNDAFRKSNRFSLAMFEFITLGLSTALDEDEGGVTDQFIRDKVAAIIDLPEAAQYSGMGVRGTQRLAGLVMPFAKTHFAP